MLVLGKLDLCVLNFIFIVEWLKDFFLRYEKVYVFLDNDVLGCEVLRKMWYFFFKDMVLVNEVECLYLLCNDFNEFL